MCLPPLEYILNPSVVMLLLSKYIVCFEDIFSPRLPAKAQRSKPISAFSFCSGNRSLSFLSLSSRTKIRAQAFCLSAQIFSSLLFFSLLSLLLPFCLLSLPPFLSHLFLSHLTCLPYLLISLPPLPVCPLRTIFSLLFYDSLVVFLSVFLSFLSPMPVTCRK